MTHELNQTQKLAHSIEGVTEYVPFGKSTTRKFVDSGDLPSFKVGNRRLISHEALVQFVRKLEAAGYTPTPPNKMGG